MNKNLFLFYIQFYKIYDDNICNPFGIYQESLVNVLSQFVCYGIGGNLQVEEENTN